MWVRWLAIVRSRRNSVAVTSRFVRPSASASISSVMSSRMRRRSDRRAWRTGSRRMPLLRMIAVDLLSRFADLLDDNERTASINHALDLRVFVTGDHDESVSLRDDLFVLVGRDIDRAEAHPLSALAVKGVARRRAVLLRAL